MGFVCFSIDEYFSGVIQAAQLFNAQHVPSLKIWKKKNVSICLFPTMVNGAACREKAISI